MVPKFYILSIGNFPNFRAFIFKEAITDYDFWDAFLQYLAEMPNLTNSVILSIKKSTISFDPKFGEIRLQYKPKAFYLNWRILETDMKQKLPVQKFFTSNSPAVRDLAKNLYQKI